MNGKDPPAIQHGQEPTLEWLAVLLGVALGAVLAGFGLARFQALHCRAHDLGNLTQAIAAVWRGEPFRCTINLSLGLPLSYLGNHFSILLAVLAPLVAACGDGRALIVVQAAAAGACIPLAHRLASRRLSPRASALLTILFLFHPALWLSGLFDVHQELLAAPLLLLSIDAMERERWLQATLLTALASLLAESVPLVTGVYWLVVARSPRARPRALAVGGAHLLAFLWIMQCAIPHFAGTVAHPYFQWRYAHLGTSLQAIALAPILHPALVLQFLLRGANVATAVALVAPMGMLPLLAPELLLAPAAALGAIALDRTRVLDIGYNHVALALPYVFAASVLGLGRLASWRPRLFADGRPRAPLTALLVANALAWHLGTHSLIMPGVYPPLSPLADWGYFRAGPSRDTCLAMAARLGRDGTICVQQNLVVPLAGRRDVRVFPDGADQAEEVLLDFTHPYATVRDAPAATLLWGLWAPDGLAPWFGAVRRLLDDPGWGVEALEGTSVLLRRGAPRTRLPALRAIVDRAQADWTMLERQ